MVDIVALDNFGVEFVATIILIVFVSLIHLAVLIIYLSNLKFSWVKRFIRFKATRIKLTSIDVPKIFEDFDTHYEDYKQIINNYKRNKHYLLNHEYVEEDFVDRDREREIKPYNIMVDYTEGTTDDHIKQSMLKLSKYHTDGGKLLHSKVNREAYLSFVGLNNDDNFLFQNPYLNEIFDKNKDITDKYLILENNRRRTITMLDKMTKKQENRGDTMLLIENMGQIKANKYMEQDRILSRFVEVNEHNTAAAMKKINPMTIQNTKSKQNIDDIDINKHSYNLRESFNDEDIGLRLNGRRNKNSRLEESMDIKEVKSTKSMLKF